jgi:hypothetical protein
MTSIAQPARCTSSARRSITPSDRRSGSCEGGCLTEFQAPLVLV